MSNYASHAPMEVARIGDEMASHIEPAMDESWPDLKKLQWEAGVTQVDSGVTVYIVTGCCGQKDWRGRYKWADDIYAIDIGLSSYGGFTYRSASTFLGGVGAGARAKSLDNLGGAE